MFKGELVSANMSAGEAALWRQYINTRDSAARGKLIERYLATAQKIAAMLYANRFDDSVEFGDYLQYARIGLLEAIEKYDPARETAFATYASYRIRGAILSGIEKLTEVATQKAQRRRLRRERLKSVKEESDAARTDAFTQVVDAALNLAIGYLLEESDLWKTDEDQAADPYASLELRRLGERIALLVAALPEREQAIVRGHYLEHKDFMEISATLGISRGRVSQLHARALKLLREGYTTLIGFDQRM